MDNEETMVEQNDSTQVDDTPEEGVVEEKDESESVESFLEDEAKPAEEEHKPEQQPGSGEPGWFKKRWDKEVGKLSSQIREEVRAEYEAQFAPVRERLIEMEAKELVSNGEIKNLDLAKELVRLRQGQPAVAPAAEKPAEQPRQANGQFAPKKEPANDPFIKNLARQADELSAELGVDLVDVMNSDPEIKRKIMNGDMDFYGLAKQIKAKPGKKSPPAPTRSPNGVSGSEKTSIGAMTAEQFARFDKSLDEGKRYRT